MVAGVSTSREGHLLIIRLSDLDQHQIEELQAHCWFTREQSLFDLERHLETEVELEENDYEREQT